MTTKFSLTALAMFLAIAAGVAYIAVSDQNGIQPPAQIDQFRD